ncbi:MAG: threonine synthase, partial [Pyrinomonadaceae bacterium]
SVATLSNAMDVGAPSNFVRILEIFGNKFVDLKEKLESVSISDEVTAQTMLDVYKETGYTLDPHGAVGYRALADHLETDPNLRGLFLETAHPVKFDSVREIIGTFGKTPASIDELYTKEMVSTEMDNDYEALRQVLLSKI